MAPVRLDDYPGDDDAKLEAAVLDVMAHEGYDGSPIEVCLPDRPVDLHLLYELNPRVVLTITGTDAKLTVTHDNVRVYRPPGLPRLSGLIAAVLVTAAVILATTGVLLKWDLTILESLVLLAVSLTTSCGLAWLVYRIVARRKSP